MKSTCIICSEEIEIKFCCSGHMCGCLGEPTEPPVCSEKCYNELMNNMGKYYPKHNQTKIKDA